MQKAVDVYAIKLDEIQELDFIILGLVWFIDVLKKMIKNGLDIEADELRYVKNGWIIKILKKICLIVTIILLRFIERRILQ